MQRERQAILALVALGRITPREAERLLAAANIGREEAWVIGACMAASMVEFLPAVGRLAHTLLAAGVPGLHHGVAVVTNWMGGVL